MNLMFQRTAKIPDMQTRTEQMQKLLRLFKTWEVLELFPQQVMTQIAESN